MTKSLVSAIRHRGDVERPVQSAEPNECTCDQAKFNDLRISEKVPHAVHEGFVHRVVSDGHPFSEIQCCGLV